MSHTIREQTKLLGRVRRIRGQVEALERALEGEKGCAEVLHQIAAVRGAIHGLMAEVIEDHIQTHIASPAIRSEGEREGPKGDGSIFPVSTGGLPRCRCSILRPIMATASPTNRSYPVSWPRCSAERISSHSPGGMAERTNPAYRLARACGVSPNASKQGSVSNQVNSSPRPTRCA